MRAKGFGCLNADKFTNLGRDNFRPELGRISFIGFFKKIKLNTCMWILQWPKNPLFLTGSFSRDAQLNPLININTFVVHISTRLTGATSGASGAAPCYIFYLYSLKPSTNCRNEVGLYFSKLSSST